MSRSLPTGANVVAALGFCVVAFASAYLFEQSLNEADFIRARWFKIACAGLGFIIGWRVMGPQVGGTLKSRAFRGLGISVWLFA